MADHADIDHSGLTGVPGSNPQFTTIELGHASDTTLARVSAGVVSIEGTNIVKAGAVTTSGLTMATDKLLGRDTASTGAIEELTIGTGLSLSSGTLSATGGSSYPTPWVIVPIYGMSRAATASVGAANRALAVPVVVPVDCTINGVRLKIENSTGNGDVGLYDSSLNRLASNGGAAWPGTGIQTINFSAGYAATAGRYYLAIAASSNSAQFAVTNVGATGGPINPKFMDTAYPLPSTITSAGESAVCIALAGIINGVSY